MNIIFNILGIVIFFLFIFLTRKDKEKKISIKFWYNDNFIEAMLIIFIDALLMTLQLTGEININVLQFLPDYIIPSGKGEGLVCALIGLLISFLVYNLIKAKIKTASTITEGNENKV